MNKLPFLNLGCGTRYSPQWVNIDFVKTGEEVIPYNLLKGVPFKDDSFEVVYHSHVLEHFPKSEASKFIAECYRVLKPGGVIRLAIPDLEQIALNYIKYLNEALNNISGADEKYEWTMLEMYDQVVRERSGGGMIEYIRDTTKNNDKFLLERNGKEAEVLIKNLRLVGNKPIFKKINSKNKLRNFLSSIYHFKLHPFLEKKILGEDYQFYRASIFRKQGEIHQWMYDRYSIKSLLEEVGFKDIIQQTAFTSNIENWNEYNLDGENVMTRKPDSLFIEAFKQ